MKKITTLLVGLFFSLISFAQVGIGTNTPTAGSILELKAADKALLLTRVATTAAVTTPVNGMMVYDISSNCIKGYQNGAWTDCLSACANGGGNTNINTGGDFGLDFTFTMKQISTTYGANGAYAAACVTTDAKVFYWGANIASSNNGNGGIVAPKTPLVVYNGTIMPTPVYLPLPNGELADKVSVGGYGIMALTTTGNVYIRGTETDISYKAFGGFATARVWTKVVIAGESTFLDAVTTPYGIETYLRGSSGKVYRSGVGNTYAAPEQVAVYTPILFPAGVTSYTDIWTDQATGGFAELFLKGNDGNIYAAGYNASGQLGTGNTTNVNMNATPVKVLFPAGVNIVKISCSDMGHTLALSSTGTAYGWGRWRNSAYSPAYYYFAATPAPADISGDNILKPSPISLPTGYNDTKFTDIWVGNNYTAVRTDKMVYFKGYNFNGISANPGISDHQYYASSDGTYPPALPDITSGATYSEAAPVWNKFKTIIVGGSTNGHRSVYAISQSDRGYTWGSFKNGSAGIGAGYNVGTNYKPVLIGTGIGDPMNPNPLY